MGGKEKRLEKTMLRSLSLSRDSVSATRTTQQTVHVGCMSGIFQLVSKYHTRRKFLTFGKKHELETSASQSQKSRNVKRQSAKQKRSSSEITLQVPRSPIIPPEIRLPPTSSNSPPRMSVFNDILTTNTNRESVVTEVAEEKRRKLLGALEKCDEDLQELKRVILAVRRVQTPPPTPSPRGSVGKRKDKEDEEEEIGSEEPSPVSVLDHHQLVARSPTMSYSKWTRQEKILQPQHQQMHQQRQLITQHIDRIRPAEKENTAFHYQNKPYASTPHVSAKAWPQLTMGSTTPPASRWSSETRESVIEVCKAVEWGQRREVGSLVLVLQDVIFRDLVDEIINDLDWYHNCHRGYARSLPYEVRKRKLSF